MSLGRSVLVTLAVLVAVNVAFLVAMVAVTFVPADAIQASIDAAVRDGVVTRSDYPPGPNATHEIDAMTECVALGISSFAADRRLEEALAPHYASDPALGRCAALIESLRREEPTVDYLRYWHGYVVLLKPALWAMPLARIKVLMAALVVLSMMAVGAALSSAFGRRVAVVFCLAIVAGTDWATLMTVATHALPFALMLLSFAALLTLSGSAPSDVRAMTLAVVAGSLLAFVDFMLNPPLAAALVLLAFYLIAYDSERPPSAILRTLVASGSSWVVGYGGTALLKQVLTSVALPDHAVWSDFFGALVYRVHGSAVGLSHERFAATYSVLRELDAYWAPLTLVGVVFAFAVAAYLATVVRLELEGRRTEAYRLALAMVPAAVPLLWFEVFSNHTQTHARLFVGRTLFIVPLSLLLALLVRRPASR